MEARIVTFPNRHPAVSVAGDRVEVEALSFVDGPLAGWLAAQPADDHSILVERAIRIGLTALQSVGVTLNVDAVRAEFDRFADQSRAANERAAQTLETVLRANFGDGDGRLPRTLESFLGDRGKLRATVEELFDPKRQDSAVGRIASMLGTYFDGDASRLAVLLDPTRLGSPLHQFRTEVAEGFRALQEKLVAIEAAQQARAGERSKSAAKGGDFEAVLEAMLGEVARGANDLLERCGTDAGDAGRSKKGDFVLTLDPELCRGAELRVVIEAKDRKVSGREMREELRAAKTNRDAAAALVIFSPTHAPAGIAPFDVRAGDVYAVIDPADPDRATLEAAVRLARLVALTALRETEAEVNIAEVQRSLTAIRQTLDAVRGLKVQLTSISKTSDNVSEALDKLREAVLAWIARAERELVS
ncbi:MAG TPA: hypothetical protein VHR16_05890 [Candidatus Limnocylindrales bacterium]|jgi:hypothetical protein|nr:hypothetical protein [Candidatus Limnocylindrales bacterium]